MKKRILAVLLAAMMVLSMTLLAGCDSLFGKDKDDDESDKELTTKELFEESIENLFETLKADAKLGAVANEEVKPFESDISFKVTKLDIGGMDMTSLSNIELTGKVLYENENKLNAKLSLSALGENVPLEYSVIDGVTYAIDLFGVNDKPIKMAPAAIGDYGEGANEALETAEKMPAIMELVYNTFSKVIEANLDDELFTAETKDVKVLATDFAKAKVITLTFDSEKIGKIANEILAELLKDNDFVEMLGEDFDKEEFAESLKDIKEFKLVNTIVDDKTVGFDVYLTALEEVVPEVEENITDLAATAEESAADESVAEDSDKEESTFAIKLGFIKNNNETAFGATAGFLVKETGEFDAEETVLSLEFSENATDMKAVLKIVDDMGTQEPFKVEATINNGRYDGSISIEADTTVIIGFSAEFGKERTNLIIDGVTVKDGEETVQEIPMTVAININKDGSADGSIKLSVENQMTIEAEYTIGIEYKDVTIPAVTDSISMDEVDGDKLLTDIQTKYPTLAGLLGSLGGNSGNGGNDEEQIIVGESHFINDEFVILLPEEFEETTAQGYTAAYTDGEVYVFVLRESYEDFAGYDIDFEDYQNLVLAANANRNPSELEYNNNFVPYFEYDFTNGGVTYSYYTTMYEGLNAYWLVQFVSEKDVYADYVYDFEMWTSLIDPYLIYG